MHERDRQTEKQTDHKTVTKDNMTLINNEMVTCNKKEEGVKKSDTASPPFTLDPPLVELIQSGSK